MGWQALTSGLAGTASGLVVRLGKGAGGLSRPLSRLHQPGQDPSLAPASLPSCHENGPAVPVIFQGGVSPGFKRKGRGRTSGRRGRRGAWLGGEQVGDRRGEGVALGGQKLAPYPAFCHYRNRGGPPGVSAELPAGKSLPQRPLHPSHRPSCARCPSLAPLLVPLQVIPCGPEARGGHPRQLALPLSKEASSTTTTWFTGHQALTPRLPGHAGSRKPPLKGGWGRGH